MGPRVLVVMTNGDVYNISGAEVSDLWASLETDKKTYRVRDIKTLANIILVLANISALVTVDETRG